jgi:transposase
VRATALLRRLLDLKLTTVKGFEFLDDALVIDIAPSTRVPRCGACGKGCRRLYDRRERRWRHLDFAGMRVELRYSVRRVDCKRCSISTELVPWAEPDSRFTRDFEQQTALLAQTTDKTTVSRLMGVAWESVGRIVERFIARVGPEDRLDGLTHIGIDEISYRKHHKYLTIVTDQAESRVVWVGEGKSGDTLAGFFDALGEERAAKLEIVSIDLHAGYDKVVRERAPNAKLVYDRFHVQRLAHNALDEVRRAEVRERKGEDDADVLKKTRWALQKNPWNLNLDEHEKLANVQRANQRLYRAYLLKESLAEILDGRQVNVARGRLLDWISWARRSQLKPFVRVAGTISKYLEGIVAYVQTGFSNGRIEGLNNKIRTVTKRAYGFHNAASLIAYIWLCCTHLHIDPVVHVPR